MRSAFLLFGPLLMLGSCMATAFADVPVDAVAPGAGSVDHLLALGPYGALVWGAYLLGRGVKVTVQVELSERDREILGAAGHWVRPSNVGKTASSLAVSRSDVESCGR